jgi:hypothetical protein
VVPDGWIANEAGGWVAPDGAHWGATTPREQPPLKLANNKGSQQRALQRREECQRRSNDELPVGGAADGENGDEATSTRQRRAFRDGAVHTEQNTACELAQ